MVKIVLYIVALALVIFFHSSLFSLGINLKLSYTFSMILPYIVEFFLASMIAFTLYFRTLASSPLMLRRSMSLVAFVAACGIAFSANKIYEGDFGSIYQEITYKGSHENTFIRGLNMVVLPNCPHCHSRFQEFLKVGSVYPGFSFQVLVTGDDTTEVESYSRLSEEYDNISINYFPEELINTLQITGYPVLFYSSGDKDPVQLIKWTNSNFGSGAWDFVIDNR